jgi:hypothetical protein
VRITRASIRAGNSFSLDLPRHSVAVITLTTVMEGRKGREGR